MGQKQSLIVAAALTGETDTQKAITLATSIPSDNRADGVDVHVHALSTNSNAIRLVASASATAGILLEPGEHIVLENHIVADDALYLLAATGDDIEWAAYGAGNPSV